MAKQYNQTVRTQFNKGLLTEYSELNFPQEASVDELNCDLFKAGNRSKRYGLAYETGYALSDATYVENTLFHTASWSNVGGDSNLEYLVVQAGNKLTFYLKGVRPLSEAIVTESDASSDPYVLDMSAYEYAGGLGASASKVDVTSIDGRLLVVSPQINSFYITRNPDDGTFSENEIDFKIRDYGYYGAPDGRFINVATGVATNGRKYDTENSGWEGGDDGTGAEPLDTWIAQRGTYPPLTHPWFSGKESNGNFNPPAWEKIYGGTSLTANGHYVIDLFSSNRTLSDGTTFDTDWEGKPIDFPQGRFSTVTTYAGRAWYAGIDSRVYYSKTIETSDYLGDCYAHNDPTSEDFSDTLATDGGYIRLPEASGIKKLHVFGSSILVFADNGVWRISGVDGNLFKADDFSVFKVTDFGLAFRGSFVGGQNSVPFWWSYNGIHTIQVTDQGGMVEVNLSRDTIQTFWEDIGSEERAFVTAIYDAVDNKILWLYPNKNEAVEHKLNNILFLDADLGAFYPWKVSDEAEDSPYIVGASFFNGRGSDEIEFTVIDSNGDTVQDTSGNDVTVLRSAGVSASSEVFFLVRDPSGSLTFAIFNSTSYLDWETTDYEAYAESSYNFISDLGRRKTNPYFTVFMRQSETGFVLEDDGSYSAVDESSLLVSAYWDFKVNSAATPQEAYRHKYSVTVDPLDLDTFPSPTTVLTTRLRLRGRGRSVRIRFEGVEGKGFNLLGWETLDEIKREY